MGNEANKEQGLQNIMGNKEGTYTFRGNYPLKINLVQLETKVSTEGINFQPSPYNIEEEKFVVKPYMDKAIRDSQFSYVPMPELSQASLRFIEEYFANIRGFEEQYDQINNQWRITKYDVEGHFLEHEDREKQMQDHQHFGTEIFLPPYTECKFQGGELKVTYNKQVISIKPHETLWTHIIMPLGIFHQVLKVTAGIRVSYVKEIWLKENQQPIQTDQDRKIKEAMRPRRHFGMVD